MSPAPHSAPSSSTREGVLDGARLLAMLAMVFGHTADALLADAVRELPSVKLYWVFRGFTAPLFLAVSGWSFWVAASHHRTGGRVLLDRFGRRAFWLLACGYFLRLPLWDLPALFRGDPTLWRHFTGFDALHAVGSSLLIGALVFAATADRTARVLAAASLTLGTALVGTAVARWQGWAHVAFPVRAMFLTDANSYFPLIPWCAYFCGGLCLGYVAERLKHRTVRSAVILGLGVASVTWVFVVGIRDFTPTHPLLFVQRFGAALCLIGALGFVPARALAWCTPYSRSSLGVYMFHILVLFGIWRWTGLIVIVGRTLNLPEVAFLSVLLLVAGLAVVSSVEQLKAAWRRRRERPQEPVLLRAPGIQLTEQKLITHGRSFALSDVQDARVQAGQPLLGSRFSLLLGAGALAAVLWWMDLLDEPGEQLAFLTAYGLLFAGVFRSLSVERRSVLWIDTGGTAVPAVRTHNAALVQELADRVRKLVRS